MQILYLGYGTLTATPSGAGNPYVDVRFALCLLLWDRAADTQGGRTADWPRLVGRRASSSLCPRRQCGGGVELLGRSVQLREWTVESLAGIEAVASAVVGW